MGNAAHRRRMNEAHNRPTFLVRSTLGSTAGGAVSPNGLTEGVSFRLCWSFQIMELLVED